MAKKTSRRISSPKSAPKSKVPEAIKALVQEKCDAFVETEIKPRVIQPPPENPQFSYIVELYNMWHRNFFYFCARYRCPTPECISEFFEVRYTRLEYTSSDTYTLAYMQHTDKWEKVYSGLSLEDSLSMIRDMELFWP